MGFIFILIGQLIFFSNHICKQRALKANGIHICNGK